MKKKIVLEFLKKYNRVCVYCVYIVTTKNCKFAYPVQSAKQENDFPEQGKILTPGDPFSSFFLP